MPQHYENIGARFVRGDGSWVESGGVFIPTDRELAQRRHKLRAVSAPSAEAPSVSAEAPSSAVTFEEEVDDAVQD